MAIQPIRLFGDPVLVTPATPVIDFDKELRQLVADLTETMKAAPGAGLAAPQIGVQKQIFVYDVDGVPVTLLNPRIVESRGEWVYDEGCLSIPGLYVEMLRPKEILLEAVDLGGNTIQIEADELLARLFQHELDHLNGVLMFERMTPDQREEALTEYKRIADGGTSEGETRHIGLK